MFYPPTIPINIFSFLILCLFWGGVSYWLSKRSDEPAREKWLFHGLIGVLSSLATLLLLTAFSFVPDDWSAVRMAVPLSLFYGYPLYPDINSNPANCNVYLPLGFLHYLPAAFLGFVLKSPSVCLFLGWITSLVLYFAPLLILIYRLTVEFRYKIILFLLAFIITFSVAPLRYVATMIHVDTLSIFLLGGAICIICPISKLHEPRKYALYIFGVFVSASLFVKQTTIPISFLIWMGAFVVFPKARLKIFLPAFFSFFILCMFFYVFIENKLMWFYCFEIASKTPQVLSFLDSSVALVKYNYQLIVLFFLLLLFQAKISLKPIKATIHSSIFIFLAPAFIVAILLSIYTFTKWGADSNHFILPSYLLTIFVVIVMSEFITNNKKIHFYVAMVFAIAFVLLGLKSYLSSYCGWYLWVYNPHELTYQLNLKFPEKYYFPWQPLGSLLAEGKFYHLDPGLQMDPITNSANYSEEIIKRYMPPCPFFIAVRPFGRESYLAHKLNGLLINTDALPEELKSWDVYIIK